MKIVCITACSGGIAHTYMAAEAVTKSARLAGDEIKIEIQGAMGIENRLNQEDIDNADLVIFAVNINVRDEDRFEGKKPVVMDPGKFVGNAVVALQEAKKIAGVS